MNPELLRNLWLEFSIRRLIAMPLALAIVFAAPLIREQPQPEKPAHMITLFESPFPDADTSLVVNATPSFTTIASGVVGPNGTLQLGKPLFGVVIAILLFLWGTRAAADSLFAEVVGRTWDSQRSSAIGPWAMTWGKLLGSTAYVWYGALFCLGVCAELELFQFSTVLSVVIAALWGQSLALFIALLLLRMAPDRTRFRATLAQSAVLPVAALLLLFLAARGNAHWYGMTLPTSWFLPASLAFGAAWTIVGIHQLMRAELQFSARPAAWIGFLAAIGLYFGGFGYEPGLLLSAGQDSATLGALTRCLLLAAIVITLTAPVSALLTPPQLLPLRRFLSGGLLTAVGRREAPAWLWATGFAALLTAASALLGAAGAGTAVFGILDGSATLAAALLILFSLRDIGILHMLSMNPNVRRGVMATIVVMALSYIAVPLLTHAVHAGELSLAFRPDFLAPAATSLGAVLAEEAIVWVLAVRAFRHFARALPAVLAAGLLLIPGTARAADWANAPCPRISGHEMLREAGLIFEGRLLSQGPPAECANVPSMCGQQTFTFQIDRPLKGDAEPGSTVTAQRLSIDMRPIATSDARLAMPQSGLFALASPAQGPGIEVPGPRATYAIDECLLGLPDDFKAEADAYAAMLETLKSAALAAPADADAAEAVIAHMIRHHDAAARAALEKGVVAFPANQTIRTQFLHLIDPVGQEAINPFYWQQQARQLPEAVVQSLQAPQKAEPGSLWVQRFAISLRRRPGEADSPLYTFADFSDYTFSGLNFAQAALRGAKFEDTHIQSGNFRAADLSGADLRWAEFDGVDLSYARLPDADLRDFNPATRNGLMVLRRYRQSAALIRMNAARGRRCFR
jgi:hypothetical protein